MHEPPRILLLERDAFVASQLVIHLEKAGTDVITANHAVQALQRLMQFTFSGAVIDYWSGSVDRTTVAERLLQLGIPFVVHAAVAPPPAWAALHVTDPAMIVAAVMQQIQAPRAP